MGRNDRDIISKKNFEPTASTKRSGPFRELADDFVDFIAMRDEELAEALQAVKDNLTPIVFLGENLRQVLQAQKLFRVRRKLMVHSEARPFVVHTSNKNVWEAWRALNAKLGPQNDAAATRTVIRLVDANYWKVNQVDKIPRPLPSGRPSSLSTSGRHARRCFRPRSKAILLGYADPRPCAARLACPGSCCRARR